MTPDNRPVRVLLACSGLEHAHRGYESFARECFDQLRDEPLLDLRLIKATGPQGERERPVRSLRRDSALTKALGRVWHEPLHVEQLAFAFSLQPEIIRRKPEVIYMSEWYTGVGLAALRRLNRAQYSIVLSNGSMAGEGFDAFDRVHQHTAPMFEYVLAHGADPTRQTLLPVAFDVDPSFEPLGTDERRALRRRLDLPDDRQIVVSVAALNRWHKRLDYLITEVARLPAPRPFVLLVGQPEAETDGLRALAQELLGEDGYSIRTVTRPEVDPLLQASDAFALTSLAEGLPRALVEGMAHGLPCFAHDYSVADYAMGGHGLLADFTAPGALAELLSTHLSEDTGPAKAVERHRFVYDSFSWDRLRPQYVDLLHGAVGRRPFGSDGTPA
jgi:glycosyltransferase involved in cell wall biosynthesis